MAELLALAVGAGEGPVAALDRVVGPLAAASCPPSSARVLADIRTGTPVAAALDAWPAAPGCRSWPGSPRAWRSPIERGTPLAGVLHAQAADVREAGRRALIESGARQGDRDDGARRLPGPAGDRHVRVLARRRRPAPGDPLMTPTQIRKSDVHKLMLLVPALLAGIRMRERTATSGATCPAGC